MADRRWKRDLGIGLLFTPLLSLLSYVLPAKTALKLVFRVEAWLYTLEGRLAIQYNGGIHTKHRHLRYHDFLCHASRLALRSWISGVGLGRLPMTSQSAPAQLSRVSTSVNIMSTLPENGLATLI
jgi:hypothetical protein